MKNENTLIMGAAFGVAIGAAIGVVTDNLAFWLTLGIGIGAAIGITLSQMNKKKPEKF